jgi:Icc protein
MSPRSALFVFCLLLPACLRPAEERAERDLTVGQSGLAAFDVRVRDGLAAVRAHSDDKLVLWQSAPHMDVELAFRATMPIELEVRNTMPNGSVTASGARATVDQLAGTGTKYVRLRVTPQSRGVVRLRFEAPESTRPTFRFALMSDVQEAIHKVRDLYEHINLQPNLDFLLGAGDLTQRGTDEQLRRFEKELEALNIPYYTTLGNHELGVTPPLYHEFFGRGSFSFQHRGARFTLLDTASATLDPVVFAWLDEWLAAGKQQFHVLAMHIPPIDPIGVRNGSFASRMEAHKLLNAFLQHGVDLTVYGHIHSFYDFSNADIPAVISGGGGAIPERFDDVGRHYVIFEVNPTQGTFDKTLVAIEPD